MSKNYKKTCIYCQKDFVTGYKIKVYCSKTCYRTRAKSNYEKNMPGADVSLSKGTKGAVSELIASTYLLSRGFEVFRALSPCCSCDLIVNLNGRIWRVEVRSAHTLSSGHVAWAYHIDDDHKYDLLALVWPDGTVQLDPDICAK